MFGGYILLWWFASIIGWALPFVRLVVVGGLLDTASAIDLVSYVYEADKMLSQMKIYHLYHHHNILHSV